MEIFVSLEVASNCFCMLVQLKLELLFEVPCVPQQAETSMGNLGTHIAICCISAVGSHRWKTCRPAVA